MNNELIEHLKRKLNELEEKVKEINEHKFILINILNELNKKTNIKLNNSLYDIDLQEEISYLNDWIEFYLKNTEKYETKLKRIENTIDKVELEDKIEGLEHREKVKTKVKESFIKFKAQKSFKYAIPIVILLLLTTSLFLLKPSIVGYVTLEKETTYNENLNLVINESDTYDWNIKNLGNIKSLKASGSVIGNGTVKVYIEKDGKKYLIYTNK